MVPAGSGPLASPFVSVASAIGASAALLLVVAGAAKLIRPSDGFAGLVGFRAGSLLVRLLGTVEVTAGAAVLWLGGPVAATVVGLLYCGFALVVGRALLAGAESCGCFGRLDPPPSRVHVVANLALAASSFAAAAGTDKPAIPAITQALVDSPAVGAALAVEVVVLAGLALVAFTALPEALTARAPQGGASELFRSAPPPRTSHAVELSQAVPPRQSVPAVPGSPVER